MVQFALLSHLLGWGSMSTNHSSVGSLSKIIAICPLPTSSQERLNLWANKCSLFNFIAICFPSHPDGTYFPYVCFQQRVPSCLPAPLPMINSWAKCSPEPSLNFFSKPTQSFAVGVWPFAYFLPPHLSRRPPRGSKSTRRVFS